MASFLVAGLLPVAMVAAVLAGLRLWRLLLMLGAVCVSVFVVLFAAVVVLDFQRDPNPANTEPPLGQDWALLYATVFGIIVCDVVAVLGVPLLFLLGGRRFRGPVAGGASTAQEKGRRRPVRR